MRKTSLSRFIASATLSMMVSLMTAGTLMGAAIEPEPLPAFEVAPFALPNSPPGEIRFEEARDIVAVELTLGTRAPGELGLSYLQESWPVTAVELAKELTQPCQFGWIKVDDWFNGHWKRATTRVARSGDGRVRIEFEPLTREFPEERDYDVRFRRTLGLRIEGVKAEAINQVRVFTRSAPANSALRIVLNAGTRTSGNTLGFEGYNAWVQAVLVESGCRLDGTSIHYDATGRPVFTLDVAHMTPAFRYSGDDGHVRFLLGDDSFTISLTSLKTQGPIWFAEKGVFITEASDPTTPEQYMARIGGQKTVTQRVKELPEQSYASAFLGQPRPHNVAWSLGFKNCRQRFWQDPNGDITLESTTVRQLPAADTARYANGDGHGRFFFGLEQWIMQGRGTDAAPALVSNLRVRKDEIEIDQTSLAAPLDGQVENGLVAGDRNLVCLVRFHLKNVGAGKQAAGIHVEYSSNSGRSPGAYGANRTDGSLSDWLVPSSPREALSKNGELIQGTWHDRRVLRARVETIMNAKHERQGLTFTRDLAPGETCDLVLKIPFVNLDSPAELDQLRSLDFDVLRQQLADFWRKEGQRGRKSTLPCRSSTHFTARI